MTRAVLDTHAHFRRPTSVGMPKRQAGVAVRTAVSIVINFMLVATP